MRGVEKDEEKDVDVGIIVFPAHNPSNSKSMEPRNFLRNPHPASAK